ncbi:MATE family efflux transporter [Vibrio sp. 10N.286.46.E10]|uniref:MATE family efflux transporter n=1 Tax=unclassified Vibrio TaxID=2614977 RepID=UPI000D36444E|nr:MATE family efflux transporter [Vibrio sp. 10N.286.46.E10]PTQ23486.1 hypothetical protein CWO24_13115 [Vibrio sp. 10N.286.46.E10]
MEKSNNIVYRTVIALFLKITGAAIGLFLSIYLSRHLGASELGKYYLALSLLTVPLTVCIFGLNTSTMKVLSTFNLNNENKEINTYFFVSLVLVLFASILMVFTIFHFNEYFFTKVYGNQTIKDIFIYLSLSLLPLALFNLFGHALLSIKSTFFGMIVLGILHNILILLISLFFPLEQAQDIVGYYVFSAYVTLFVAAVIWIFKIRTFCCYKFNKKHFSNVFEGSTSNFLAQSLGQLYTQVPILIIGHYYLSNDVAHYGVSLKLAMLISFILMAVNRVVAPDFSFLYSQGEMESLKMLVRKSTRLMIAVSLPVLVFVLFFGEQVLSFYGDDFIIASKCLTILAFSQFIYVFSGNVNVLLQMSNNENVVRDSSLVSAISIALLSTWLVPLWGIEGAAVSTLISMSLANALSAIRAKNILGINTFRFW